jgi:oligosaccharide repeat unit polymerase
MFLLLTGLTGLVLTLTALRAYLRSRDALHPAIVIAPPFLYTLSVWPLALYFVSDLSAFLDEEQLAHVQWIYLLGVLCFCAGLVAAWPKGREFPRRPVGDLSRAAWRRVYAGANALGVLAVSVYLYSIYNVGGFMAAYGRYKGGGRAPSGYIGEAILFAFPAVLGIAVCCRIAGRIRPKDIALCLIFMSPHLLQGTLGGRRGPIFLALASLLFAWLIARGKRVRLGIVALGIGIAGMAVLFVYSQRRYVYLGSEGEVQAERLLDTTIPEQLSPGNTYLFSAASILTAEYHDTFYWGYRYFVTFFIRPIPRQLWPTKYQDMDATWVLGIDEAGKLADMRSAVGFYSEAGAAMPSIADVYIEFRWGMLPFMYGLGWAFSKAWTLHRTRGREWTIVYVVMLGLSVYLATQSFSAFAHRALFICLPTLLFWKYWLRPRGRRRRALRRARPLPA